jgi:hypothetical protein
MIHRRGRENGIAKKTAQSEFDGTEWRATRPEREGIEKWAQVDRGNVVCGGETGLVS